MYLPRAVLLRAHRRRIDERDQETGRDPNDQPEGRLAGCAHLDGCPRVLQHLGEADHGAEADGGSDAAQRKIEPPFPAALQPARL
jgi:hypothetical protein